jgi:glycosyltransferase involved in cell wall biosynthesis
MVEEFQKNSTFPIQLIVNKARLYKYGSMNVLLEKCDTKYAFMIDDDDELLPDAMEKALSTFQQLKNQDKYCSVVGRCIDFETKQMIGVEFPKNINDGSWKHILKNAMKVDGEKVSLINMDIYKRYRMPIQSGVTFVPEALLWGKVLKDYREYYTNDVYRIYHQEDEDRLTNKKKTKQQMINYYYSSTIIINERNSNIYYKNLGIKYYIINAVSSLYLSKKEKQSLGKIKRISSKIFLFVLLPLAFLWKIKSK